jgi:hypothetical protein
MMWESATAFGQVVATDEDVGTLPHLLIKDFGGVTMLKQSPSPLQGVGARDPRLTRAERVGISEIWKTVSMLN